jgi:alanyl-tRNA synthetase
MAYQEAVAAGAMALFDEKYGDRVRVVGIDSYSRELCGGTHVQTTAEIGLFLIVSEASVGGGARRIEAVTGRAAAARARQDEEVLRAAAELLRASPAEVPARVAQLVERTRALEHEVEAAQRRTNALDIDALIRGAVEVDGVSVVGITRPGGDQAALRALGDRIKARLASGVIVAAAPANDRIELVVMATPGAVARGADADKVMAALNRRLRTRGGGRRDLAQGGGGDPTLLDGAMADLAAVVREVQRAAAERRQ